MNATPFRKVAMLVTKQQAEEIYPKLLGLGYKAYTKVNSPNWGCNGWDRYMLTNSWATHPVGQIFLAQTTRSDERMLNGAEFISEYNPELYLALAAQSEPGQANFNVGEYVQIEGRGGTYKIERQDGPFLSVEHVGTGTMRTIDFSKPKVVIGRPDTEALTKVFARKEAKEHELKFLRQYLDVFEKSQAKAAAVFVNGFDFILVTRDRAKVAFEMSYEARSPQKFVQLFTGKGYPRRKLKTKKQEVSTEGILDPMPTAQASVSGCGPDKRLGEFGDRVLEYPYKTEQVGVTFEGKPVLKARNGQLYIPKDEVVDMEAKPVGVGVAGQPVYQGRDGKMYNSKGEEQRMWAGPARKSERSKQELIQQLGYFDEYRRKLIELKSYYTRFDMAFGVSMHIGVEIDRCSEAMQEIKKDLKAIAYEFVPQQDETIYASMNSTYWDECTFICKWKGGYVVRLKSGAIVTREKIKPFVSAAQ